MGKLEQAKSEELPGGMKRSTRQAVKGKGVGDGHGRQQRLVLVAEKQKVVGKVEGPRTSETRRRDTEQEEKRLTLEDYLH